MDILNDLMRHNTEPALRSAPQLLWEQCKRELRTSIPEPFFSTFISPLKADEDRGRLVLITPDSHASNHIRRRYWQLLEKTLGDAPLMVVAPQKSLFLVEKKPDICQEALPPAIATLQNGQWPSAITLIYGRTGSGKSTLALSLQQQGARLIRMEEFYSGFARACRTRDILNWRQNLRSSDLILDDFQFIKKSAGRTQEELINLIDDFSGRGQRLLLLSDVDLPDLELEKSLASRLQTASRLEMSYPCGDARLKLLAFMAERHSIQLTQKELEELCLGLPGDIRSLQGALLQIKASGKGDLSGLIARLRPARSLEPTEIMRAVALFYDISLAALGGPGRDRRTVEARQVATYLLCKKTSLTLSEIARLIGRRDHTAVIHGRKRIESRLKNDFFLARQLEEIAMELG